jgi:S-adenosylmethionine hydrolase
MPGLFVSGPVRRAWSAPTAAITIGRMIVLFTDYGIADPYVGQLRGVLAREAPGVAVVDLLHTVPAFDARAGAYLLAALAPSFAPGSVFVCVVDPGVGGMREALMVQADECWYVGPDNGLFEIIARRGRAVEVRAVRWRPPALSESFHGRDLFAPVAARLARGVEVAADPATLAPVGRDWPDDLPEIIYIDHFGNCFTGLRAGALAPGSRIRVGERELPRARVFAEVSVGSAFWYENSLGLVEVAVNRGHAARQLGLKPGDGVTVV